MRDWLQDPLRIPKSADAQLPYIKGCRIMHRIDPTHLQIPNHRSKILLSTHSWLNLWIWNQGYEGPTVNVLKKSECKWTHAVQTCVGQGSTVIKVRSYWVRVHWRHKHMKVMWRRRQRLELFCHKPRNTNNCQQPPARKRRRRFLLLRFQIKHGPEYFDLRLPASRTVRQ